MNKIVQLAKELKENLDIDTWYVGGCVRDEILGLPVEDIDICLSNVQNSLHVYPIINKYCKSLTSAVGNAFPVWIGDIDGKKIDFALARTETLIGNDRKQFKVTTKGVHIKSDLYRRDFTINAIAKNVITNKIYDPYEGVQDLEEGILRPVSHAFKEDSLRVIRGARFAARFDLTPTDSFYKYASEIDASDISNERVGMELMKAFQQCSRPSIFFNVLRKANWLRHHFKELENLIDVPQDSIHHPEGDAYVHTLHTIDACEQGDWFTRAVMLIHDLGKAVCTSVNGMDYRNWRIHGGYTSIGYSDTKIQSIGHEAASVPLGTNMLKRIKFTDYDTIYKIGVLAELHMLRIGISNKTVRKTLRKLTSCGLKYEQLVEVCRCDVSGRPPLPTYTPDIGQDYANKLLEDDAMTPIVTGELLLQHGIQPGKEMGEMIKKALEFQDRETLNKQNWKKVLYGAGFKNLILVP